MQEVRIAARTGGGGDADRGMCGAAGWRCEGRPQATTICNCSICCRNGAVWPCGYLGHQVLPRGETRAFATGSRSRDHLCPTCRSITHHVAAQPCPDGRIEAAVNRRMVVDPAAIRDLPFKHSEGARSR